MLLPIVIPVLNEAESLPPCLYVSAKHFALSIGKSSLSSEADEMLSGDPMIDMRA